MSYYYRNYGRSYRRGSYWPHHHISQRRALTSLFGGIDEDIERIFLNFRPYEIESLLIDYRNRYGYAAEAYARKTYFSWKNNLVKMSGQTAERLLDLVPPLLSEEQRYDLISKLRQRYVAPVVKTIHTTPENWKEDVLPILNSIITSIREFILPPELYKKATWLANGDSQAVHRVLNAIEERESLQRTALLAAEIKRIEQFVSMVENTRAAAHTINIPRGTINIVFQSKKPSFLESIFSPRRESMSKGNQEKFSRENLQRALSLIQSRGSLLNLSLDDLSEDQRSELKKKILEERIGLELSQAKADERFFNSTRDMANTIRTVQNLEDSTRGDYTVDSKFETASGNTTVTVRRENNKTIIIIAVVIGIVLFLLLR